MIVILVVVVVIVYCSSRDNRSKISTHGMNGWMDDAYSNRTSRERETYISSETSLIVLLYVSLSISWFVIRALLLWHLSIYMHRPSHIHYTYANSNSNSNTQTNGTAGAVVIPHHSLFDWNYSYWCIVDCNYTVTEILISWMIKEEETDIEQNNEYLKG